MNEFLSWCLLVFFWGRWTKLSKVNRKNIVKRLNHLFTLFCHYLCNHVQNVPHPVLCSPCLLYRSPQIYQKWDNFLHECVLSISLYNYALFICLWLCMQNRKYLEYRRSNNTKKCNNKFIISFGNLIFDLRGFTTRHSET